MCEASCEGDRDLGCVSQPFLGVPARSLAAGGACFPTDSTFGSGSKGGEGKGAGGAGDEEEEGAGGSASRFAHINCVEEWHPEYAAFVRARLRTTMAQVRRCYEIFRLAALDTKNEAKYTAYR